MKAVIFDMDGVIVDSEPFWQQAEGEVFSSLGVQMNSELCKITQRMTTSEVTKFWFHRTQSAPQFLCAPFRLFTPYNRPEVRQDNTSEREDNDVTNNNLQAPSSFSSPVYAAPGKRKR